MMHKPLTLALLLFAAPSIAATPQEVTDKVMAAGVAPSNTSTIKCYLEARCRTTAPWQRVFRVVDDALRPVAVPAPIPAPPVPVPPVPVPPPHNVPPPAPVPVPVPPVVPPVVTPPVIGDTTTIPASIPSNFDVTRETQKTWGDGSIPQSAAPDVVGAFRFTCKPSHVNNDDPILYPGVKNGSKHGHQFFGNTLTDAYATYVSLRTTGDSTCQSKLNRSAYWIPWLVDPNGKIVAPDYISIYYKRAPAGSAECARRGTGCVITPRGLRYVFGFNMVSMTPATGSQFFQCVSNGGNTIRNAGSQTIAAALKGCPIGAQLEWRLEAPDCWDGVNLDSADHRSHVNYASYATGVLRCPSTHPKTIAQFTQAPFYTVTAVMLAAPDKVKFSSDVQMATEGGTTGHGDWFGAWDDPTIETWTANCIDKLLNCSGGDLGNGRQLINP